MPLLCTYPVVLTTLQNIRILNENNPSKATVDGQFREGSEKSGIDIVWHYKRTNRVRLEELVEDGEL